MDFDFSPDQQQLKDQARRFLAGQCDRTAVRAVLDGPQSFDARLWQGLADQGYLGAAIPEAYGGLGASHLLRITKSMTTNTALVRYPISSLIGELVHGQDGRSYTQAGARWSVDAGGQDARAGGQRRGRGTADGVHMEGPSR